MRNKHFVHDENSTNLALPAAIIANESKTYKVEKVVCSVMQAATLEQDNFFNLVMLVDKAFAWMNSTFDLTCDEIAAGLEKLSREELLAMPASTVTVPGIDDISTRRKPV